MNDVHAYVMKIFKRKNSASTVASLAIWPYFLAGYFKNPRQIRLFLIFKWD